MKYLVDKGTGTILNIDDNLVIVDVGDDDTEADILEIANNPVSKLVSKAIVGISYELPLILTDRAISGELNDYVYNSELSADNDDNYFYCLSNPDTWPLIRDAIIEDNALWNEYSDTWSNAILTVAERHREVTK